MACGVCAEQACTRGSAGCNVCSDDNARCLKCSRNTFLHDGACVTACPDGHRTRSSGGLSWCEVDTPCTAKEDGCHLCSWNGNHCERCYESTYLHDGRCGAACPDGFVPVGKGRFSRTCEPIGHYSSPFDGRGCLSTEVAHIVDGIQGSWCAPTCNTSTPCPASRIQLHKIKMAEIWIRDVF